MRPVELEYTTSPDDLMKYSRARLTQMVGIRRDCLRAMAELDAPVILLDRQMQMVRTAEIALRVKLMETRS